MLKLYYTPNTCSLATHIALEEAGADYETVRIDFASAEQTGEAYRAINPKGRVPALVTDGGILTETPALLLYVCQLYPAANLAPLADPFALAQVQSFNSYLCSTVHVNHAHGGRGYRWADDPAAHEAMKAKVPDSVGSAFALIEDDYLKGPWVMGKTYTICDAYLFTIAQWLEGDKVDVSKLPRVLDHRARVKARPAVQRALAQQGVN